jgi:hypothetical protein
MERTAVQQLNIDSQYNDLDESKLREQLLTARARLRIEQRCGEWLDNLVNDLHYEGDSSPDTDELYDEYMEFKKELHEKYKRLYGIVL